MDKGAWWATIHAVGKVSELTEHLYNKMALTLAYYFRTSLCLQTDYTPPPGCKLHEDRAGSVFRQSA